MRNRGPPPSDFFSKKKFRLGPVDIHARVTAWLGRAAFAVAGELGEEVGVEAEIVTWDRHVEAIEREVERIVSSPRSSRVDEGRSALIVEDKKWS